MNTKLLTPIIFFDIPSRLSGPTSPNTWKVRLVLNFKRLEYQTRWVPTTQIEVTCRSLGIPPTGTKPSGEPRFTFPALIDYRGTPSEPVILSDSTPIIEYLERTYPSPSKALFPNGTRAFHAMHEHFIAEKILSRIPSLWVMDIYNSKLDEDRPYFRHRMEMQFGKELEDIEAKGSEREQEWNQVELAFSKLAEFMAKNGAGDFIMGDCLSFSDFALCSCLIMLKRISPNDSWRRISSWENGKWLKFVQNFEPWINVDHHPNNTQ